MPGIPESWKTIRMPYAASVVSRDYQDEFELLSVYLNRGVIPYSEGGGLVHKPSEDLSKYQHVVPGDIVLNNQQAWRGSVGVSRHFGNVSPAYIVLRPTSDWHPGYLNYLLRSPFIVTQLEVASRGVGDIQRQLSRPWMRGILFPMPPVAEQRRIADFLDHETAKIDALITKQEQLITTLDERRGAVISRAVTRGLVEDRPLRDSGVEWLGRVPTDWEVRPLWAVTDFSTGWTPPSGNDDFYSGDIPWVNISDLGPRTVFETSKHLSLEAVSEQRLRKTLRGQLMFSFKLSIGQVSFAGMDCYTNEAVASFSNSKQLDLRFAFYMLPIAVPKNASENIYGAKMLNARLIKSARIIVPPLDEQKRISEFLDRETNEIDELKSQANGMKELLLERRQALISAAVTGKLEVGV